MMNLIEGVTTIKWIGNRKDKKDFNLYRHKSGLLVNKKELLWISPEGVEFCWLLDCGEGEYWEFTDDSKENLQPTKEKSTGGSSNYYKITLPEWVIEKHKSQGFVMLEDLAEVMFDNNFNYVNVFKAQKRMFELEKGGGKEGNSFEYDATKSKYYIDKQVEVFNRK